MSTKTIATYTTSRGNIALEVTRHTDHKGNMTYSYNGRHGAGSGHALKHVQDTIRVMMATHKGIRLTSGWDIMNEPAPVVAPVAQTREQAEAANAKEWAQSLPTAQLERLLGDARDYLQSLGAASLEAVKAEWNARKDASQTPAEPAPSVESAQTVGNHCLALNSKNNTFALVSTDAAAAIMSMGSVEGFNGVNHSLKTLDKVVIRQDGRECCVDIHKGASVFSSLPSGRVEAKKLAAQLAALYSAPLFNVKESGKIEACSPSPAEPVKVLGGEAAECLYCPNCGCLAGVSSHAAHLAKIQRLETALKEILVISDHPSAGEVACLTVSGIARAALSLPSA